MDRFDMQATDGPYIAAADRLSTRPGMSDESSSAPETPDERVAFVPRDAIAEESWFRRGFHPDPDGRVYDRLQSAVRLGARPSLERDPGKKQLIPYVVVVERSGSRILTLRRRTAQSEERLHGQWSIGVGGHISEEGDGSATDAIRAGMRREFHEELHAPDDLSPNYCGLLNDDSDDVGRVHLGLVYRTNAEPHEISVREVEKMEGSWKALEELERHEKRLESWSQLLLEPLRSGAI